LTPTSLRAPSHSGLDQRPGEKPEGSGAEGTAEEAGLSELAQPTGGHVFVRPPPQELRPMAEPAAGEMIELDFGDETWQQRELLAYHPSKLAS